MGRDSRPRRGSGGRHRRGCLGARGGRCKFLRRKGTGRCRLPRRPRSAMRVGSMATQSPKQIVTHTGSSEVHAEAPHRAHTTQMHAYVHVHVHVHVCHLVRVCICHYMPDSPRSRTSRHPCRRRFGSCWLASWCSRGGAACRGRRRRSLTDCSSHARYQYTHRKRRRR